jgi:ribosomal subunit interface protein
MQTPLQLTFRSMVRSDALANHLQQRAERLDLLFDRVISCHVVVELAGHHHRHGDRYQFAINVGLPGHELIVTNPPPDDGTAENAYGAADRAFDEAERQLEHWVTRQRRDRHEARPSGRAPGRIS